MICVKLGTLGQLERRDRDDPAPDDRLRREVRHTHSIEDAVPAEIDDRRSGNTSPPKLGGEAPQIEAPVDVRVRQDSAAADRSAGDRVEVRELVRMDPKKLHGRKRRKAGQQNNGETRTSLAPTPEGSPA